MPAARGGNARPFPSPTCDRADILFRPLSISGKIGPVNKFCREQGRVCALNFVPFCPLTLTLLLPASLSHPGGARGLSTSIIAISRSVPPLSYLPSKSKRPSYSSSPRVRFFIFLSPAQSFLPFHPALCSCACLLCLCVRPLLYLLDPLGPSPPLMDGRKAIVVHCPCYLLFFYQRHISPVPASFAIILYDNCYCWLSAPLSPRTRAPCHRFFRFFFLPTRARRQTEPPVFVGEAPSPFPLPTRPCLSPPPRRPTSCKETSLCVLCFSPLLAIAILGLLSRAAKRNAAGRSGSRARAARLGDALRRAARESAAIAAACCTAFVCACSAVIRAHSCL